MRNRFRRAVLAVPVGLWLGLAACRRDPQPPEVRLDAVDPALASGIRSARSAVEREPGSAGAWGRLGQALEAAEFMEEARGCYARAVSGDPASARWHHLLALREVDQDPASGLDHLARAALLAGTNTDAPRLRWAQALGERGQVDPAVAALKPLLDANPAHPAARLELARLRLAQGRASEGAELVAPCLTNPYTARHALLVLAQARQRLGDAEGAAAAARRAAAMPRPFDWPDPFLREVQALRKDRQQLAEQANSLVVQNRLDEAGRVLETLLATRPGDAEGLLVLGRLRLRQERCAEAEETLRQHLRVRADSLNGLVQLGLAQMCQSHWADAAASFARAVELKPDFAQAHANLAMARAAAGDLPGGVAAVRQALRCSPGDAGYHALLGELLARSGDLPGAREAVGRALQADPNQPRARTLAEKLGGPRR